MSEAVADICIIGGGAAGLSVAAGAAQMGARTVLVEAGRMGGECLNAGCVPSKALIAAARVAHLVRHSGEFGIQSAAPVVNHQRVRAHLAEVIAGLAPHDSEERFIALGCTVLRARARFLDPYTIEAGDRLVRARRFVIATGSRPLVPPIPGLAEAEPFTNETIFDVDAPLDHLLVIGGGPIGCELAQAHRRLGARVTIVEQATLLPQDDPEMVAEVRSALAAEGIRIIENASVLGVQGTRGNVSLRVAGQAEPLLCSHILVAAGRRANTDGLGLDEAGVTAGPSGIEVDARQRTSNRRIFAIGDVAAGPRFTHLAAHQAGIVLRNALFRWPAKVDLRALPWVTFTEPEIAQVGQTEAQARGAHGGVRVLRARFADNDRARTERRGEGLLKVVTSRRGRILGASAVGPQAGDVLAPWILAIQQRLNIAAMARLMLPYPTLAQIGPRAAGEFFAPTLFGPKTRRLVRLLSWLG